MNLRKHKTYQILVRFIFLLAVYMIAMGTITVLTFTKATPTLADEHNKQILTDKDFSSKDLRFSLLIVNIFFILFLVF